MWPLLCKRNVAQGLTNLNRQMFQMFILPRRIGLPKMGTGGNQTNKKNYKVSKPRDTKFMPLNATNVALVKDYFNQIHSQLYDLLAQSNQFVLYQFEGQEYEIFLIPVSMSKYIKRFTHEEEIKYAGIHLGYMRRHQTKTGFARAFYLSYEGGEFLYDTLMK